MMSEDEIRRLGKHAQAWAIANEGAREEGQELGTWWFAELILGEKFPEMDEDEADQYLEDNAI